MQPLKKMLLSSCSQASLRTLVCFLSEVPTNAIFSHKVLQRRFQQSPCIVLNPEGVLHILDNLNLAACGIIIAHKTQCTMKNFEEMHQQSSGQVLLNVGSNEYLTKKKMNSNRL